MLEHIQKLVNLIPNPDEKQCFYMGWDCEMYGANEINCHFSLFSTPEKMKKWEEGKEQARKDKIG